MKKTIKIVAACLAVAAIVVTGCSKKGDTGPAGPAGANGVVPTTTDGFIKGNVSGTRQNGAGYNLAFNLQNYWNGHSATLDSLNAFMYMFNIQRAADIFGTNSADVSISTTSLTSPNGTMYFNSFALTESLGANKEFDFSITNNGGGSPTANVTGISYNKTTGLFTGSFSATLAANQNSTGNIATMNGTFSCTVTQLYMMVKHTNPNQIAKD